MRVIKFRAWDGKGKCMMDWLCMKQSAFNSWTGESCANLLYDMFTDFNGEITLMQYTGLKDKNGKEIYEGDVVSIHDATTRPEPYVGQVKWDELATGFESFPKGQLWGMFLHDHPMLKAPLIPELEALVGDGSHRTIEVIGNIYENPNWDSQ